MNNNQMPYGWNPNMGGNPMMPWPNNNQGNCNCSNDIRNLEGRINRIERQLRRLEERVSRMDANYPTATPYNDSNYGSSNNYSQGYNMM